MQDGEPGADDALGVGGARGTLGPPLADVGPDGFILHRRPALAMAVALGALPGAEDEIALHGRCEAARDASRARRPVDRKSTRLNSSHVAISYAVLCVEKKN